MTRNIIDEILDIKSRLPLGSDKLDHLISINGPLLKSFYFLKENATDDDPTVKNELLKHYPIALVARLESYYRLTIKKMIDNHQFFRANLKEFKQIKFNIEPIIAIGSNKISVGELVSHVLTLNNLSNINDVMSKLTQRNYVKDLKALINISYEQKTKPTKDNAALIFKHLNKMYELRHIFCHELSSNVEVHSMIVEQMFTSVTWLYLATEVHLSHVLNGKVEVYDKYYQKG